MSGIAAVRAKLERDGRSPVVSYGPCQVGCVGSCVRVWRRMRVCVCICAHVRVRMCACVCLGGGCKGC